MSASDMEQVSLGELIRYKRESLGLSAREVGRRAGLSDSYVIKVEANKMSPSFKAISRIMVVLSFSTYEILLAIRSSEGIE